MRTSIPIPRHPRRALAGLLVVSLPLASAGCDGKRRTPTSPDPGPTASWSGYLADATLTAFSGVTDCGWRDPEPAQRNVEWTLYQRGSRAELSQGDEGDGYGFVGTLEDNRFVGRYLVNSQAADCQIRELWIDATFEAGLESFEASEAWYWGPTDNEEVMAWHWTARRVWVR